MIIAEIGVNHFGDMNIARELIRQAKACGADLAKFQLYDVDKVFPDGEIITQGKNWYDDVKKTQLTRRQARELFILGELTGIEVFFSVFDVERVAWCEEIGVKRYKIAFSQRNNNDLIDALPAGSRVIISSNEPSIPLRWVGDVLYCIPKYPADIEDVDFDKMQEFDGFSDHTVGIEAAKKALDMGTEIIEKHFCLNRQREGVDIPVSITPEELKELVEYAKNGR